MCGESVAGENGGHRAGRGCRGQPERHHDRIAKDLGTSTLAANAGPTTPKPQSEAVAAPALVARGDEKIVTANMLEGVEVRFAIASSP